MLNLGRLFGARGDADAVVAAPETSDQEGQRRRAQKNLRASVDCMRAFDALAKAEGLSHAALFEDMVARRLEAAQQGGLLIDLPKTV